MFRAGWSAELGSVKSSGMETEGNHWFGNIEVPSGFGQSSFSRSGN